jgi:hypothetical protein
MHKKKEHESDHEIDQIEIDPLSDNDLAFVLGGYEFDIDQSCSTCDCSNA